jgi:hypothetical protein
LTENTLIPANPGPWVDPERREAQPWLTHDGIVKFFEFPVRIPTMSHRAFHLYWQRHHSPNVMNVTGFAQFMRKYNSGHRFPRPAENLPAHYRQDPDLEGAAEVWLNSWREVGDWLGHPLYEQLIQPDEPRFIAQDERVVVLIGKEEHLLDGEPDLAENGMIKLYVLMSRRDGLTQADFSAALSAHGADLLAKNALQKSLRRCGITHRLADPNPIEGARATDVDAVMEFWFATRADLDHFVTQPAFVDMAAAESRFCDVARTRAIVAKLRVVHDEFSFQPSTTQPLAFSWD